MKTLISKSKTVLTLTLATLGLVSATAQSAHAVYVQAEATVTPGMVTGQVCNSDYDSDLQCRVKVVGLTQTGNTLFAWVNLVLAPGQCEYAYVYANYPYYFVNGDARADCRIVRQY